MPAPISLTTLCFDLPEACSAELISWLVRRRADPGAGATRHYVGDAVEPQFMAWLEGAARSPDLELPSAMNSERMEFALARDVGRSSGTRNPWLYIVHTDIPGHIVDEYNAWYDEEHLPRLVSVPGVERARRYVSLGDGPRFLTAYELTIKDAFESPEGLKARKTPWTEKMRSLFFNTRRRMYRQVDPAP